MANARSDHTGEENIGKLHLTVKRYGIAMSEGRRDQISQDRRPRCVRIGIIILRRRVDRRAQLELKNIIHKRAFGKAEEVYRQSQINSQLASGGKSQDGSDSY